MLEEKSEIEYPCLWNFKIIGREEKYMRRAIAEIVGDGDYTLTFSNQSRHGKYRSLKPGYGRPRRIPPPQYL